MTFEWVALAAPWPPKQWVTILAPYLTGRAQMTFRGLPTKEAQDYGQVKAAMLNTLDITPEMFQWRFQDKGYPPGIKPRWSWRS